MAVYDFRDPEIRTVELSAKPDFSASLNRARSSRRLSRSDTTPSGHFALVSARYAKKKNNRKTEKKTARGVKRRTGGAREHSAAALINDIYY